MFWKSEKSPTKFPIGRYVLTVLYMYMSLCSDSRIYTAPVLYSYTSLRPSVYNKMPKTTTESYYPIVRDLGNQDSSSS